MDCISQAAFDYRVVDHLDVMLDLETWGTKANAVVISIGACIFDPNSDEILDRFYVAIDADSCVSSGLTMDVSTLLWWMAPDRDAPRQKWLAQEKVDIYTALEGFAQWCPDGCVWGNGASFDNAILSSAYTALQITQPWKFWNDRCYRTLKGLAPAVKLEREGTHHDALDDAVYQAKHMQAVVAHLGLQL